MQFIDLKAQQQRIQPDLDRRMREVLEHGRYVMGPEVEELEERLADYVGVRHCIGVSSGTNGLLIALMALGIGPGDEVITTPFSFIATVEVIRLLGAVPVFVDIVPRSYNIDPLRIEAAITDRTRAIMPVSLYGQCADFDAINAIAERHNLPVIEDAAQSFGATYKGRRSCGLSTIGVTSFFPSKPLGCYGDGGACFTNDDAFADRMRQIRIHGQDRRYHHPIIGLNGRLDTLQAAILLAKFEIFDEEIVRRQAIADRYSRLLAHSVAAFHPPYIASGYASVFAQFTINVPARDALRNGLHERGIPTAVHYPTPLHLQPAFADLGIPAGSLPAAERACQEVLSLPMHPYLEESDQARVVDALAEAARNADAMA